MGVLKEYWGKGVGKLFFKYFFTWSEDKEIVRYELTTAVNNKRAFTLYKSVGFDVECIKKQNIMVKGEPVDEYQMFYIVRYRKRYTEMDPSDWTANGRV